MTLREVPGGAPAVPGRGRRAIFVPLIIVLVLTLVAAATGVSVARSQQIAADRPAPIVTATSSPGGAAAACRPTVEAPEQEPWLEGDAAAAEAEWAAHADVVGAPVLTGLGGWADWNDVQANNLSQVIGRRNLSTGEVERWIAYFRELDTALQDRGVEFYVLITPPKWAVYPQHLPLWLQQIRGSGPMDQLMAAADDLPLIDVREPLREASAEYPVFTRTNSHWSPYGAAVAWEQITRCFDSTSTVLEGLSVPDFDEVVAEEGSNEFEDYGVRSTVADATFPVFTSPLAEVIRTDASGAEHTVPGDTAVNLRDLPVSTRTPGAQSDATALVFRDSFGDALSVYLQQSFAQTWQTGHAVNSSPDAVAGFLAIVDEHQPDVVILQIAGRYLNNPPA